MTGAAQDVLGAPEDGDPHWGFEMGMHFGADPMEDSNPMDHSGEAGRAGRLALRAHERARETLPISLRWHVQNKRPRLVIQQRQPDLHPLGATESPVRTDNRVTGQNWPGTRS